QGLVRAAQFVQAEAEVVQALAEPGLVGGVGVGQFLVQRHGLLEGVQSLLMTAEVAQAEAEFAESVGEAAGLAVLALVSDAEGSEGGAGAGELPSGLVAEAGGLAWRGNGGRDEASKRGVEGGAAGGGGEGGSEGGGQEARRVGGGDARMQGCGAGVVVGGAGEGGEQPSTAGCGEGERAGGEGGAGGETAGDELLMDEGGLEGDG